MGGMKRRRIKAREMKILALVESAASVKVNSLRLERGILKVSVKNRDAVLEVSSLIERVCKVKLEVL
ncbi:hypothetical protein B6U84_00285 [Candidatus Bathyarchaeota archaeon ex4484_40]|nr:MAG: hypothetical protein B6U84_00285 [Candidatus Bathyarchaeota archaeon ex4484_40]RLF12932.1 MAG: hypothetical protein DRJ69_00090 [Thermoprotei archaeon]